MSELAVRVRYQGLMLSLGLRFSCNGNPIMAKFDLKKIQKPCFEFGSFFLFINF